MKKTLLVSFLLFVGMLNAQVVNIPDVNFKNHLLDNEDVNTNGDGEIQVSEALAVTSLDITEHPNLTGPFSTLEGISAFSNLINLYIHSTVTTIDLTSLTQLESFSIIDDDLVSLDLTGLDNLTSLFLEIMESLSMLDVSSLTNLKTLSINGADSLTLLTIGYNPNFEQIWLNTDSLVNLDLSGCPNLTSVHLVFSNENQDVFINLKNGNAYLTPNASAIYLNGNNTYNCYVCVDEGEAENFAYLDSNIVLNTYCSFTPGGDYNTIAGNLYFDADNDGCSPGDEVQGFATIHINDGTESGSNYSNDGTYQFYVESGPYTVTPVFINNWFTVSPASATVNLPTIDNSTTTQDFCLTPNGVHPDLEVLIVPVSGANPGFDISYQIIYKNKGNQSLSGDIVFTYDDAVLDFLSANPANTTSGTGSLTWNYTNLQPFQEETIDVAFNLNGPMETPAVNNGDYLDFTVSITPDSGDETPADNTFALNQLVEGSFDPNDITCLEGDLVHPDMIGEYLHYNINFENTGDAEATFIVVKDIINEAQFDVSSLQMLYISHDVEVKVADNKVEFFFDDIDLGPLEKGNVTFKIKTLNTLQVNDNVMQQADIFFDYNWPIQTNEANTMFAILSSGGFELDNTVKVYPNPAVNVVNIEAATEVKSVQLYDVAGRLLQTALVNDMPSIDIASRASGIYFVKITTEEGGKVEKVIKQ